VQVSKAKLQSWKEKEGGKEKSQAKEEVLRQSEERMFNSQKARLQKMLGKAQKDCSR